MKKNELEKLPVVDEKCEMPSEGTCMQQENMIKAYIFEVRGKQVILDFHLAKLYAVENRTLKQAVRRNVDRFPNDFMFRLTKDEANNLISIGISQSVIPPGYNPGSSQVFAFTEQGVSMLASVLRSSIAVEISIAIIRAFVSMRQFISQNAGLFQRVELLEKRQCESDLKIEKVLSRMDELSPAPTTEQLFSTGCVWDAYTFVSDLVRSAQRRLVLIDPFVDERTLLLLDKRADGVECTVHTRYSEQVELDFQKHNLQCAAICKVQLPHAVHDRYLIVDEQVWLMGASVKDMGRGLCTVIRLGFSPEDVLSRL